MNLPANTLLVETEAELRAMLTTPSKLASNKIITSFETQSRHFIRRATFVAITTCQANGLPDVSARCDAPGFLTILDDQTLIIPNRADNQVGDSLANLTVNPWVGLIFLVPGVNETMRVNGKAQLITDEATLNNLNLPDCSSAILVKVEEIFLHCPLAFARSKLWGSENRQFDDQFKATALHNSTNLELTELNQLCRNFMQAAPFLFLGTTRSDRQADLSPRGDPPGFVQVLDNQTIIIPERPGNRLADNISNILNYPYAGLLFVIPGVSAVLKISGRAVIIKDASLLQPMAMAGKTPLLGIGLEIKQVQLLDAPALAMGKLWEKEAQVEREKFPTIGQMLVSQLQSKGVAGDEQPEEIDTSMEEEIKTGLY